MLSSSEPSPGSPGSAPGAPEAARGTSDPRVDRWEALGSVAPAELRSAALELHWAVQLLAAAGAAFAEPVDDDSHRATTWHEGLEAFVGADFDRPYPLRAALRPHDLTLLVIDRTDAPVAELALPGQSLDDALDWLGLAAATYFGGAPPKLERPAYDLPAHPVADGAVFTRSVGAERRALSALYGSAASVLESVARAEADASPVRCWPHHFDVATLITLSRNSSGEADRTIGLGLAPRDADHDDWYWYVTPWPYPDASCLEPLDRGRWHTDGWTGAVLSGSAVVSLPTGERRAAVLAFLHEAIAAARSALD